MHIDQRKEQFSEAFVHAIATVAGFGLYWPAVDDDSVDVGIAARGGLTTSKRPRVELQLKCTHVDEGGVDTLAYDLKMKNYNDLRIETIVPRILVVLLVPEDVDSWLHFGADEMCLHRHAYWRSLLGLPEVPNENTIRVHLQRSASFSPDALRDIMERINGGGQP